MSDRKTIAFWCERSDQKISSSAEFHVNLWHFSSKKRPDFFEIGILPDDPSALQSIKLFVPFEIRLDQIEDLGPKFASTELAQGIFNEALSSTLKPNGKSIELRETGTPYCEVHVFSPNGPHIDPSELVLESKDGGTLITITSVALQSLTRQRAASDCPGYFRLRFLPRTIDERPFVTTIKPQDRAWRSGFEVIEYIDCRLNEARTLPKSITSLSEATLHGVAETSRVVFLAVVPVVSSVTSSHAEWHKSRLLENEIWRDYVPAGVDDGMVVYHWRKVFAGDTSKTLHGFSAFVKMVTRKTDLPIIAFYVAMALSIGAIGSICASLLQALVNSSG